MNNDAQNPNMTDNFHDESSKKDKITFASRLKNAALKIANTFREYPITLGSIVLIAAIGAVIIDCNFDTEI